MLRPNPTHVLVLASLAATVAAACGSSSEEEPGGPALAELPALYAAAACRALESCAGSGAELFLGGEDCETRVEESVADLVAALSPAFEAGTVRYRADRVEACLDALGAAGCGYDGVGREEVCLDALDGTVPVGGDCDSTEQCEGTAYCKSGAACPGTCAPAEPVGGACEAKNECATGLDCDKDSGKCFEPAAIGQPCGPGSAPGCGDGGFCLGADEEQARAGTCQRLAEVFVAKNGEACSPVDGPLCGPDLHCVITAATAAGLVASCQPGVAAGAACQIGFPDPCPASEFCQAPEGALAGTCTGRPVAAQACARGPFSKVAEVCGVGLRCDDGVCREPQPVGGTCAVDQVCLSEHCVGGRCALDGACE